MISRILLTIVVLAAVLPVAGGLAAPAQGSSPQSVNVAVVPNFSGYGGAGSIDPADFPSYTFTQLSPGSVSSKANLAPFDTVILWQFCDVGSAGNATFRSALLDWLDDGHKLIIWDSDSCNVPDNTAADYSWLSVVSAQFQTDSPGQLGAQCPGPPNPCGVTVTEENYLSSANSASPYYINTVEMATTTDAVGDLNVIIAKSTAWCEDMFGTNIMGRSGPSHAYTKPGKITNGGMIIYSGLDYDFAGFRIGSAGTDDLVKTLELELAHGWGPAGDPAVADLLCQAPIGELQPVSAYNMIGTAHTVTVTIKKALQPVPGVTVTFEVISGPHTGVTGSNVTNASGQASFTYTGTSPGTDTIVARWVIDGDQYESNAADKVWEAGMPPPTLTPTPTRTPTPGTPQPPGVGGTVNLPPGAVAAESGASAEGSGWTVGTYAALAGVGAVVAIAAGGWYARRRWLR